MVLFDHTKNIKILDLATTKTDPTKNHRDIGATLFLLTQPYFLHSPLEDTSVTLANPPPHPSVEVVDAVFRVRVGDFPDVRLLGADYMLFGV